MTSGRRPHRSGAVHWPGRLGDGRPGQTRLPKCAENEPCSGAVLLATATVWYPYDGKGMWEGGTCKHCRPVVLVTLRGGFVHRFKRRGGPQKSGELGAVLKRVHDQCDLARHIAQDVTFPEAENTPSGGLERCVLLSIPLDVATNLRHPIRRIVTAL
jgi:hypothetical protein